MDLLLFLNFLFNFSMFLLFESKIVKLTFFLINLYFFGKKLTSELKKIFLLRISCYCDISQKIRFKALYKKIKSDTKSVFYLNIEEIFL